MGAALAPDEAEAIRRAFLDRVRVELFPPDVSAPEDTLYLRILDELSRAVTNSALSEAHQDAPALKRLLNDQEASILNWVQAAGDEWSSMEVWRHKHDDEVGVEHWTDDRIQWLSWTIEKYYRQAARSALLDRVLIDMLMALQVSALAAKSEGHAFHTGAVPSLHAVLVGIVGRSLLTLCSLALLFFATKMGVRSGVLEPNWAAGPATLIVVFGVLSMPPFIINRLGKWGEAKERQRKAQVHLASVEAYGVLAAEARSISLPTLRCALKQAEGAGVTWIAINRVLADLEKRGVEDLPALRAASS